MRYQSTWALVVGVSLLWAGPAAAAVTPAEKCESSKLKEAGKYGFCRLKAEAKSVTSEMVPDYSKCDAKFTDKWGKTETKGGGMCPPNGDQSAIKAFIAQHTDDLAAALAGGPLPSRLLKTGQTTTYGTGSDGDLQKGAARSFSDNGDGAITDNQTGLMWEKKSDDDSIHDKDNGYTFGETVSPYTMNGTMVTTFLAALNRGGGFAGYTDWRIPNANELESIRDLGAASFPATYAAFNTGCIAGCTVTTCSCTRGSPTLTSTTYEPDPTQVWNVSFGAGGLSPYAKGPATSRVRAVRGP